MVSGTFADANILQPSRTLYDHCLTLIIIVVLSPLHGSIKKENHRNNTEGRLPLKQQKTKSHQTQKKRYEPLIASSTNVWDALFSGAILGSG